MVFLWLLKSLHEDDEPFQMSEFLEFGSKYAV